MKITKLVGPPGCGKSAGLDFIWKGAIADGKRMRSFDTEGGFINAVVLGALENVEIAIIEAEEKNGLNLFLERHGDKLPNLFVYTQEQRV